jgi:hypothetical protein
VAALGKPESGDGLKIARMTRIVLRIFYRHDLSSQLPMIGAMAEIQFSDPSIWQARAARARRIANMLSGYDAETVLAYARECDEQARKCSPETSPSTTPATAIRATLYPPSSLSASRRAA